MRSWCLISPGPLRAVYEQLQELQRLKRAIGPSDPRRERLLDLIPRVGALVVSRRAPKAARPIHDGHNT